MRQRHESPKTVDVVSDYIRRHGEILPARRAFDSPRNLVLGNLALQQDIEALVSAPLGSAVPARASITTGDGIRIAADLNRARTSVPRGAIVFVHGFCGNRSENGLFRDLSAYAAIAGFHALSYDWRGIGESDGWFPETTIDDHVADFESVVDWARSRIDDEALPIHVVGFSLGAAVVGLALGRGERFQSLAYLSPAVRPRRSMWPRYDTPDIRRELAKSGVVAKPDSSMLLGRAMLEALREIDLGPDAFNVSVPLLVCHGTADTRIDCAHTQELVVKRGRDDDFAYLELCGASHSFRPADSHWQLLATALISWFMGERASRRQEVSPHDHVA